MLKKRLEDFYLLLPLYFILFFIPLYKKIVPLLILLFVVGTFIKLGRSKNWKVDIKLSETNVWWFFLWVLGFISLLYTENSDEGFFDLQVKATMMVFPLIFSFNHVREIIKINFFYLIIAWLAGIFVSLLYHLGVAFYKYIFITHSMDYLFYTYLSGRYHPSYLSLYVVIAIIIIHDILIQNQLKPFAQILLMIFHFSLYIFVFLLSSKANIISLFLVCILFLYIAIRAKKQRMFFAFNIFLFVFFLVLFMFSSSIFRDRVHQAMNFPEKKILTGEKDFSGEGESTRDRVLIYRSAWQLISENPWFGVGVGDVRFKLSEKYLKNNFSKGVEKKFNAHNQFLQNWIAVGILGFVLMGIIIFNMLRLGWVKRKFCLFSFALVLLVNLMVESMLETQAGSIFIVLMSSLLVIDAEN